MRQLGRTGMTVSALTLGTVELGMDYGFRGSGHYGRPAAEDALRILRRAVELGITCFDTARAYGEAEALIGRALPDLTPRPLIASKFAAPQGLTPGALRAEILRSVETSLATLGVETIDLLQIHNTTIELLGMEELHRTLEELRSSGKVRVTGASLYGKDVALAVLEHDGLQTLQVPHNLLDQQMEPQVFPAAKEKGAGILVRSAFLRGVLTAGVRAVPEQLGALRDRALALCEALEMEESTLAETALRYCLSDDAISTVLIGVRNVEELEANAQAAAKGPLTPEQLAVVARFAVDEETLVNPGKWSGLI